MSTCTVDRLTDLGDGKDFVGDLRYCITQAQDGDSIQFAVKGMLNLTRALPNLTRSISIEGPGADQLTVRRDTGGDYRIFTVGTGTTVSISGLTLTNGRMQYGGGAIENSGMLTITDSTISGNTAWGFPFGAGAGGISNRDTLTLISSTVSDNSAVGGRGMCTGGGVSNSGTLTVISSTFSGNTVGCSGYDASAYGGGIGNYRGTLTVDSSTFTDNRAFATYGYEGEPSGYGGGIANFSPSATLVAEATIRNSTFSGNRVNYGGGGLSNDGWPGSSATLSIFNSTVSGNEAEDGIGGGIYSYPLRTTLGIRNTIIAGNTDGKYPSDLSGRLASSGHNLIGNSRGGSGYDPTDLLDVDPLLGKLQDNGGPTETMALLTGSPAIDAGDNEDAPEWDQRGEGFPRIVNKLIDIGAFEVQDSRGPRGGPYPHASDRSLAADLVNALTRRAERTAGLWAALPEDPETLSVRPIG